MERSQVARALMAMCAVALLAGSCANPFAPALRGSTGSLWTDATTVGGLLQNFVTAYELEDSLSYAELLAEDFQFQYYDPLLQRTEGWYRETDLRATSRMFHSFQNISLIWGGLTPGIDTVSTAETPVEVRLQYQLLLDELSPLIGFARFTLVKPSGGRYRIVLWQDDF